MPIKEKIAALMMVSLFCICLGAGPSVSEEQPVQAPVVLESDLVYLKIVNAVASSFEETPDWAPKPDSMAPADGKLDTRWSPESGKDGEWIYFDLGKTKTFSKIVIHWEDAFPTEYELLVSDDAENWKSILLVKDGKGGIAEHAVGPLTARYVKLIGLVRVNPDWGFSMWEVEIYGPAGANPEERALAEVFPWRGEEAKAKAAAEAVTLAPGERVPSPGPVLPNEFHKGVNYTSWSLDELAGGVSDTSLAYLAKLGVKHVALMVVWYMDQADAKSIYRDEVKTVSDESLIHAINLCHKLGMKVQLKSHVDLKDEDFRTNILPSEEWFADYKKFIAHYAELSAKNGVEIFSIGTELPNTTIVTYRPKWLDIIQEVRRLYSGPIVYGANWDEYPTVSFWDSVDYIGMDAYFPLTEKKNPPLEELVDAWKVHADEIEAWLAKNDLTAKGVIFTEVGYDAIEGSNTQPWRVLPTLANQKESQDEQRNCLDAMMTVMTGKPWFRGIYWWNYFPRPDLGPLGYTLRGKKGEETLVDWFKKT